MRPGKIICIDFGSAYTKIAMRSSLEKGSRLVEDHPLASEPTYCVPSVVARVTRGGRTRWAVGEAAAALSPGDGVDIHRYWKAKLFDPAVSGLKREHLNEIAVQFFQQIRSSLVRIAPEAERYHTRICIPKLAGTETNDGQVVRILEEAGWHPAETRPALFEPESNAIGVFTRGRNATHSPKKYRPNELRPYFLRMFDQDGFLAAMRNLRDSYSVLVVDIGAYTTDFSYIMFDTDVENPPRIRQVSRELGIGELDQLVRDHLDRSSQHALDQMSTSEREKAKLQLYAGKEWGAVGTSGRMIKIGEGAEKQAIAKAITVFASRVTDAEIAFRDEFVKGPVNAYVITGGGAFIPAVRSAVIQRMSAARFYDLLDRDEPDRVLLRKQDANGRMYLDSKDVEARLKQNRDLMRGGSAIGGASIFFDIEPDPD